MSQLTDIIKNDLKREIKFSLGSKSYLAAYGLWLLFGWAGAHRFYLGKRASAALMLALSLVAAFSWGIGSFAVAAVATMVLISLWLADAMMLIVVADRERNRGGSGGKRPGNGAAPIL